MVSSANARGVMQVMPGTWDWVQRNLASTRLNPASAEDNVRAGSLYLARLLRETGGDARLAAAGYYQGLHSVRTRGMYDDTKQLRRQRHGAARPLRRLIRVAGGGGCVDLLASCGSRSHAPSASALNRRT